MSGAQRDSRLDAASPIDGDDAINLRQLLTTLWQRKTIIVGTAMVITSIALLVVLQLTPIYVAEAEIVVEPPRTNVVDIDTVAQSLATDYYTNETQAAIIASRVLAEKVVDRLGLIDDPLFNPSLRPTSDGWLARLDPRNFRLAGLIPDWWRAAFHDSGADDALEDEENLPLTPEQERQFLRENVIGLYRAQLSAVPSDNSRVITVAFASEDPEMAARVANAVVELYIEDQLRTKSEQTERANAWLQNRAIELKSQVEESARAVEEHRRDSGLVNVDGSSLLSQQLAELNSQLIAVRAQHAEARARFKQMQKLLNSPAGIDSAAAVLASPLIQRLREQEAEVVRKIAEMKTQYRDSHPKMILARSELRDLVAKIESEVRKIALNLGNELEIAQVREVNLEREIERLQGVLDVQSDAEITLSALEAEFGANQKLYDTILARFKETNVQDASLLQPDARIISFATTPTKPAYPRKRLVVGVAFITSAILGILIVLLLEHLDSGFRSREQLEAETGMSALSIVPGRSGRRRSHLAPYDDVLERPNSLLSESLRTLRTSLLMSNVDQPPRTVIITSSVPGEGKTTTSLALARTVAKNGQKCILIDGDLRKPGVHTCLDVLNGLGLIDYLSYDVALEDIIQIDFKSGAHYILAGRTVPHSTDLLGSDKMHALLLGLREVYDLVIVDAPPVLAMSDTLIMSRKVDKTVFLVRAEKTRRETVLAGIRQLLNAGADLAGAVLTRVDMRKLSHFNYANSGYYGQYGYGSEQQEQSGD